MKDNEQSRFVRWGIPGWTMFLAFITFAFVDIILTPDSRSNNLLAVLAELAEDLSLYSTASAIVALLVAASGIPLGFLIYQIYFYIRWNSPFSRDGLFPPFIVGRWNDMDRTLDGIKESEILGKVGWRKAWARDPLYKVDHGWKWRYIENLFIEIVQNLDSDLGGVSLHARSRYLMDLMHTLGAGLFGIYLGYLAYLMFKVKTDSLSLTILTIVSAISLFILVWLLEAEDKMRKQGQSIRDFSNQRYLAVKPIQRLPFVQFSNPTALYLIFLFAVLYLGSPSPYDVDYTQAHLIFRLIVIGLIIAAWVFSKRHYPRSIVLTELMTMIIFGLIAYLISQTLRGWSAFQEEWWGIGWVILLFLFTNLIFTKNRQNIRDDLIALQNYTLKRYLASKSSGKIFASEQE